MITNAADGAADGAVDSVQTFITLYAYSVSAVNGAGQALSAAALVRTPATSPTGFATPVLLNASNTSLCVMWTPPLRVNGIALNYLYFVVVRLLDDSLRRYRLVQRSDARAVHSVRSAGVHVQ